VRGAEQNSPGFDGDRPAIRQNRHGHGGHGDILDHQTARASLPRARHGLGRDTGNRTV
jgi:hypothetical protein